MFAKAHLSHLWTRYLIGILAIFSLNAAAGQAASSTTISHTHKARIAENYGNLPLSFEANRGQADARAKFLARGSGYRLYLTGNEAVLALCQPASAAALPVLRGRSNALRKPGACAAVRMRLEGTSGKAEPVSEEPLPGTVNYFIGNDPAKWRTGIHTYAKVRYSGMYPGIDLVYYGNQGRLEYDFVVAPGADPQLIRLRMGGVMGLHLAADGDLVATTAHGALAFRKPSIYQVAGCRRVPVAGNFVLLARHTVGFRLGHYDRSEPLVIDPALVYSTFLGGNGADTAYAIAVDANGEAYIAGSTSSTNFPVTPGAFQSQDKAAANQSPTGFIAKLNATGTALVYATYLGGSGASSTVALDTDSIRAIAVDSAGDAYVTGTAASTDFPVTPGALQTTNNAAVNQVPTAFVTELNPTGTALVYSTYLGGSGSPICTTNCSGFPGGDTGVAIALDATGDAYVAGKTYSANFPVTAGAFQTTNNAVANETTNAFVSELNPTGTALIYSTYLGGSDAKEGLCTGDGATGLAVDSVGNAYLTGSACSTNFPVTPGAFQTTNKAVANQGGNAFVSKLNPTGTTLVYSTYLGGSEGDSGSAIAVDTTGNVYVAGESSSTDFPVTAGAFQTTNNAVANETTNAFVSELNPTGTALIYSTYLGGSGGIVNLSPTLAMGGGDQATGLAIDSSGNAYVAGSTASANFPVTPGAYQSTNNDQTAESIGGYNAFVTELNPTGTGLVYSTFLGGNGLNPNDLIGLLEFGDGDQDYALALDGANNVYVTGSANSEDFPVTGGAFQLSMQSKQNAFVTKLDLTVGATTAVSPTIGITQTPNPATSAQPITVTIAVSGPSGSQTPTGAVTMSTGGYGPLQATLNSGSATFDIPAGTLPAWRCYNLIPPYTIPENYVAANYVPDAASSSLYAFTSAVGGVYVAGPCTGVTPDFMSITPAQAASQSFMFVVTASSYTGLPLPTGTVTFSGSYTSPALPLVNNSASITVPAGTFQSGNNTLWLSYSGDSNYTAVSNIASALVDVTSTTPYGFSITGTPVTIQAGATTGNISTITVTPAGSFTGAVDLTCAVITTPASPTSPVTCSIPSSVDVTGSTGASTTLTVHSSASTTSGNYVIAVNGVSNATGTGLVNVTVTAPSQQPGFALSNSGNITVSPGATTGNTSTITVTPANGFTGSVALTAAITSSPNGAIDPPTLSFGSTSPVSITGAGAGTATLTIATTASTSPCTAASDRQPASPWHTGGAILACILLFGIPARRRNWRRLLGLLLLSVVLAGGLVSCGGSSSSNCSGASASGTTPGTYTITVTGTSGATTATGTVGLTVQ